MVLRLDQKIARSPFVELKPEETMKNIPTAQLVSTQLERWGLLTEFMLVTCRVW